MSQEERSGLTKRRPVVSKMNVPPKAAKFFWRRARLNRFTERVWIANDEATENRQGIFVQPRRRSGQRDGAIARQPEDAR